MNRMRLIDADKINFKEVFGGQSDYAKDLRKAAQELIDSQPTAFDKEMVIEDLTDWKNDAEKWAAKYDEVGDTDNMDLQDMAVRCYVNAIKIVEKGGIE